MADYTLSKRADEDLDGIYKHTFLKFGETQADVYFSKLIEALETLVGSPTWAGSQTASTPACTAMNALATQFSTPSPVTGFL